MSNRIIWDIETAPRPLAEIESLAPEFSAPDNYKDPVKIANYITERKADWLDKAALSPLTGSIVAIGYVTDGQFIDSITDEATMLRSLWATVQQGEYGSHAMVGFNTSRFDVQFCVKRSWLLNVPVPRNIMKGRYVNDAIFTDLAEVWSCGNHGEYASLKTLARYFGIGDKDESQSEHFGKLLLNNLAEAIRHLENDLRLTEAIADRLLGRQEEKRAPGIMSDYREAMP